MQFAIFKTPIFIFQITVLDLYAYILGDHVWNFSYFAASFMGWPYNYGLGSSYNISNGIFARKKLTVLDLTKNILRMSAVYAPLSPSLPYAEIWNDLITCKKIYLHNISCIKKIAIKMLDRSNHSNIKYLQAWKLQIGSMTIKV